MDLSNTSFENKTKRISKILSHIRSFQSVDFRNRLRDEAKTTKTTTTLTITVSCSHKFNEAIQNAAVWRRTWLLDSTASQCWRYERLVCLSVFDRNLQTHAKHTTWTIKKNLIYKHENLSKSIIQ